MPVPVVTDPSGCEEIGVATQHLEHVRSPAISESWRNHIATVTAPNLRTWDGKCYCVAAEWISGSVQLACAY